MWMTEPTFENLVNKEWCGNIFPLEGKIASVTDALINCNKHTLSKNFKKKKKLIARIEDVQEPLRVPLVTIPS